VREINFVEDIIGNTDIFTMAAEADNQRGLNPELRRDSGKREYISAPEKPGV